MAVQQNVELNSLACKCVQIDAHFVFAFSVLFSCKVGDFPISAEVYFNCGTVPQNINSYENDSQESASSGSMSFLGL